MHLHVVQHVDDAENVEQLAACRSRAGLLAVSSNVKVPSRKVSDGDCLTLGEGRGWQQGVDPAPHFGSDAKCQ